MAAELARKSVFILAGNRFPDKIHGIMDELNSSRNEVTDAMNNVLNLG